MKMQFTNNELVEINELKGNILGINKNNLKSLLKRIIKLSTNNRYTDSQNEELLNQLKFETLETEEGVYVYEADKKLCIEIDTGYTTVDYITYEFYLKFKDDLVIFLQLDEDNEPDKFIITKINIK